MICTRRSFIVVLTILTVVSVVGLIVTPAGAGVGPNPPGSLDPAVQPEPASLPGTPPSVTGTQILDAQVVEGDPGDNNVLAFELVTSTATSWSRTFDLYTFGITATSNVDFIPPPPFVVLPAGETSLIIEVVVVGDLLAEGNETLLLHAKQFSYSHLIAATGTIIDDDPVVAYSLADAQVYEGDRGTLATLSFELTASEPLDHDVTFFATTQTGTAMPGEDYVALSYAPVVLKAGETSTVVQVQVVGDLVVENTEKLTLQLYRLDAGNTWHLLQATGTILDDDAQRAASRRGSS